MRKLECDATTRGGRGDLHNPWGPSLAPQNLSMELYLNPLETKIHRQVPPPSLGLLNWQH